MLKKNKALMVLMALLFLAPGGVGASEAKKATVDLQKGYQLAKKKCISCHDSAANPEAGRKTRDEWHVVVDVMHKQFQMKMTKGEQDLLIDYFYTIRKGLEKDPG
jgi:mono/diheme cytochrome c family protein